MSRLLEDALWEGDDEHLARRVLEDVVDGRGEEPRLPPPARRRAEDDQIDPAVSENEARLQIADIVSPETDQNGLFTMTEERWRTILDFFRAAGTLQNDAEVGDVMTTAIQEAAMGGASSLLEP